MAKKESSPDWFARTVAMVGLGLSIVGLVLTYFNFRWQKEIYAENIAERILVRLSASRTIGDAELFAFNPKGEVGIEVVNTGLRHLYIKKIEVRTKDNRLFQFFEYNPTKTNEQMKLLEPSEAVSYRMSWDFSEHPLGYWGKESADEKMEDMEEVEVETTNKLFSFQHQKLNRLEMSWTPPSVRKKKQGRVKRSVSPTCGSR
jgi:hypothetical protein